MERAHGAKLHACRRTGQIRKCCGFERRPQRLIVEEALEGEVFDALGRERYERGEGEKAGYRNGYRTGKVKTAEGAVDYSAPQVRDTPEPFVSPVRAALSGRTQELERLAVELYARGLSTRDIE